MNNYEFCVQWILDQRRGNNVRVLDYGCGAGQIVKALRLRDVDAYGCDVFYEGADYSSLTDLASKDGMLLRMEGDAIPFDSASFDFVINNQVMEHVDNLDRVLTEVRRVLKPGGKVINLFPDKGVWREGHCGVPFLHWFPKGSRPRVYYAAACRAVGLGYHKQNKSVMSWSQEFCEWLDRWTYYRSRQEIDSTYDKYFCDVVHIEDYWLKLRLGERKLIAIWLPTFAQRLVVRKLAGLIFVARKPL
ncbi:methyltransferase domain-containing protein [Paraburkholderia sp. CNPSo 3157]|uniref:Methyltransferase domain-containing protein n=2 Tax=Paraburkholderia franconis TaxID=2654983 RepID=A0A7X1N8U9_9BURK|nr:methyltransferase domain-containing protein [Paraburkholderia franconis]